MDWEIANRSAGDKKIATGCTRLILMSVNDDIVLRDVAPTLMKIDSTLHRTAEKVRRHIYPTACETQEPDGQASALSVQGNRRVLNC